MIHWVFVAGFTYLFYNVSREDLMYYCEMKTHEYMGIYPYEEDSNDDDDTYANIKYCDDSVIIRTDVERPDEIVESSTSIIDTMWENLLEKMSGYYFEMLATYYSLKNKWCEWGMQYRVLSYMNLCIYCIWNQWTRLTCPHLLEPEENEWVDNVSLYRVKKENGKFVYSINDSYTFYNTRNSGDSFKQIKNSMAGYAKRNQMNRCYIQDIPVGVIQIIDHLVIGKCLNAENKPKYIMSENASIDKMSKASFMSVEYIHPLMEAKDAISLNIPHEMFLANNVLFTPTHVLRLLKHQGQSYYFDMDYTVKIVDGMINIFSISCNECIVLNANGYTVETHIMEMGITSQ